MKDLKRETAKLLAGASQGECSLWKLLRKWFITLDAKLNPLSQAEL